MQVVITSGEKLKYFENSVEAPLERILECVMYSVKGPALLTILRKGF
jgi:hypothetical protein